MITSLHIAASQFPVSGSIIRNRGYIHRHIEQASTQEAHVVLFPETALPGYGPKHLASLDGYGWDDLSKQLKEVCNAARENNIWVILGSMRQTAEDLTRNCIHVISNEGDIIGTYDKRHLHGTEKNFYEPGDRPLVCDIEGHTCGFLICYDNCYPNLYEEYRDLGVSLLFHAVFNAENSHVTSIKNLMDANIIVRAADHQMSIAASNSSARYSPFASCIARPDGTMVRAKRHVTSLIFDDYPAKNLGWMYDNRNS